MIDVVILFFVLGLVARLCGSTLRVPPALYETLSIYLLLAIGLKGGVQLAATPLAELYPQVLACVAIGFGTPFLLVPLLMRLQFDRVDSAALAAHYGSVSVVTFAVATAYLERAGVGYESHAALWLAVMEAPALVSAAWLGRSLAPHRERGAWRHLAKDVLAGPSVMLLAGGLAIGAAMGSEGIAPIRSVFFDPFKGVLTLFMLELGLVVGGRLGDVRRFGLRLAAIGVGIPPALALLGMAAGWLLGLSAGGVALLATLSASASYIAAPTAMRIALPGANPGLAITAALAISFPFNVLVGVPLYVRLARMLA